MRPQKGRQKLLDAAMNLFESKGYFATTIAEITVEAGVSKGLVYNYFESKEELLTGLITEATDKMESVVEVFPPGKSIEESLLLIIDNIFGYLQSEKRFLKLQLTLMLMPELKEVVSKPLQHRAELLLKILSDWFRQAGLNEPENKARLFLAMLDGVSLHYLSIYEGYPLTAMKQELVQAAYNLCGKHI